MVPEPEGQDEEDAEEEQNWQGWETSWQGGQERQGWWVIRYYQDDHLGITLLGGHGGDGDSDCDTDDDEGSCYDNTEDVASPPPILAHSLHTIQDLNIKVGQLLRKY